MRSDGNGGAVRSRYVGESQSFCGKCYDPAFTHVDGVAVCEIHAKAYGVSYE